MEAVNRQSKLWQYLTREEKALIETGEFLLGETNNYKKILADYSYLVFPFAKVYEGFLKKFFLDGGFINKNQYESDHFRIGKVLNPNLKDQLGDESVYHKIAVHNNSGELANELWITWKRGRNLLFHYFPHNLSATTLSESEEIIKMIVSSMEKALELIDVQT